VAAPSSPDASEAPPAQRFRRLRELGEDAIPTWAALEALPDGGTRLVVLSQVSRGDGVDDGEIADWVRDSQRLATLEHANVARVRDVVVRGDEVIVASEFVDGVRWAELASGSTPVPLEIALRIFVDVLSGLGAIHGVRDAKRQPLKLVHGALSTAHVVVGSDGVSRVIAVSRVRSAARPGHAGNAYLAPEVLLADDAADARADVYSVGVMLWEALCGRPLFPNTQPSAIVTTLLSGRVPRAEARKEAPWSAPLVDVVARALSVEPDKRFPSASAMAMELKRIAGVKLVPSLRVAALVRAGFGDRIRKRREELERGAPALGDDPATVRPREIAVDVEAPSSSTPSPSPTSLTTTRPPPPPAGTSIATDSIPVVMSSEPPTEPRPRTVGGLIEVLPIPAPTPMPPAPAVPRELLAMAAMAADALPARAAGPPEPPAATPAEPPLLNEAAVPGPLVPSVFASLDEPATSRRSRALVYGAVAGPVVLVLVGLLAWLGFGGSAPGERPAPATAQSVSTLVHSASASPPAAATPGQAAKLEPAPTASAEPGATSPAAPTELTPPASASAASTPPPSPAASSKPRPIIKYDPQGI